MPPRAPRPRSTRPRRRWFAGRGRTIVIAVLVVLVVLFVSARSIAGYYVDYLWYQGLGHSDTYWTMFWAKSTLLLIFALGFAVVATVNFVVADRIAPLFVPDPAGLAFVDRYRELVGGRQKWVRLGAAALLGLMLGVPTVGQWRDWLLFRNYQSFGVADPQFDTDVGFYVFRLPFLSFVMTWAFAAVAVLGLAVAAAYVANGSLRFQMHGVHVTRGARVHLSLIGAVLALVKAGDYWLQRYSLTTSTRGVVHGATYTDVKAQLPAINLLILVCLLVAVLFLVSLRRGGWRMPVAAAGLWLVVAVVAGAVYPAVVQRFVVQPNVTTRERPYIERNLEATKAGMNIGEVTTVPTEVGLITTSDVQEDTAPLEDVRLLNPAQMQERFSVDQGQSAFFAINDLDPDRYTVEGRTQQVLVAARELNSAGIPNKTWVSRHLTYTHGCGIVAAPASQIDTEGIPAYFALDVDKPELYVGEGLGDYAITNTDNPEHPCDEPVAYSGTAGVKLDSTLKRLAFAVHFGEYNLFGSSLITRDSQILYVRDVRDRVEKLAPFLSLDADPYPVVVAGKVQWVLDAFTTTSRYPYSQRANTSQLTEGSGLDHAFNYVRNSVKAVVDAYTGEVTLYVVDDTDPIVRAWQQAFPDLFHPSADVPAELRAHFRYPEDLFRVQTNVYGRYQFDDPTLFFNSDLRWSVAQNPADQPQLSASAASSAGVVSPTTTDALREADTGNVNDADTARFVPYYTMFHAPDGTTTFSMLRPFVRFSNDDSRRELVGYMTVSSDPDSYGQLTVYRVTNAELPAGPAMVAAQSDSTPSIAQDITLLGSTGSKVSFGNLQLVPIRAGLLYVRPLYVQPTGGTQAQVFVRKVIVTYNNRSVMADSLSAAVNQLFPGADVNLGEIVDQGGTPVEPAPGDTVPSDLTAAELLAQAQQLFAEADALTFQDGAQYAELTAQARELVNQALAKLDPDIAATIPTTTDPTAATTIPTDEESTGVTASPDGSAPTTTIPTVEATLGS